MVSTPSQKLRQLLLEIIIDMAERNLQPLEQLIDSSDADLVAQVVFILRFLNDARSRQILSRLLQNKSNLIRVQALKAILARDDDSMDEIFVLIDDPDESIRELILQHLGKKRSEQAEELMLEYLNSGSLRLSHEDHYMAVCRTLGRCGSDLSIPCFKKQIFRLPVLGVPRFKSSIMRRGATCALKELNTQKAGFLIERNERGVIKNLFRPV
jgi:HEAT repeat protein